MTFRRADCEVPGPLAGNAPTSRHLLEQRVVYQRPVAAVHQVDVAEELTLQQAHYLGVLRVLHGTGQTNDYLVFQEKVDDHENCGIQLREICGL